MLRMKVPLWTCTGADQVVPSSEWVTKMFCPAPKSFQEMYIRPKKGLAALLSTHIDSRSSAPPLWAQAPMVQVIASVEVHRPIPRPPHPLTKSPANHLPSALL